MAYQESFLKKVEKLIISPRENYKKILPFLLSKAFPYLRRLYEFFGVYFLSKPYPGHEELLTILQNKRNGFFVQCGGNDGYGVDPTYYLEKALGWEGVIAEPLPIYKLCEKNRSHAKVYNCAVGSFDNKNKTISFVDCNLMSFVKDSIDNQEEWVEAGEKAQSMKSQVVTVPIKPVQELIDNHFKITKPKEIDLFVADTEGYEFEVIKGLNFTKNSPKHILLEIHKDDRLALIKRFLEEKGYKLVKEVGFRDFLFKLS